MGSTNEAWSGMYVSTARGARWREDVPVWHTAARDYIYPGRRVLAGDWPAASPEVCADISGRGEWRLDGEVLVCTGCGLDVS